MPTATSWNSFLSRWNRTRSPDEAAKHQRDDIFLADIDHALMVSRIAMTQSSERGRDPVRRAHRDPNVVAADRRRDAVDESIGDWRGARENSAFGLFLVIADDAVIGRRQHQLGQAPYQG